MRLRIMLPREAQPKALRAQFAEQMTVEEEEWDDGALELVRCEA